MKQFEVINNSKFETMSHQEMESVKGGSICLLCMKRDRYNKKGEKKAGWKIN